MAEAAEEQVSEEIENEEETDQQVEEQEETTTQEPAPLTDEQLARRRGWKPASEWVGDLPDNFVDDPAKFNEDHERINPRLRSEVSRLNEELSRFEGRFNQAIEAQNRRHQSELKRERERLLAEMRDATESADTDRFDRAKKSLDELATVPELQTQTPQQNQEQYHPDRDPHFKTWHADNAWYRQDAARTKYAEQVAAKEVAQRGLSPQRDGRAFYDAVTREVEAAFGPAAGGKSPNVNTGGRSTANAARPAKAGFDQLPADMKGDFKWMVQRGIFKNDKESKERYAAQVYADNPELKKKG